MQAEMTCFAVLTEVLCPYAHFCGSLATWTGSGSVMGAPLRTAKKSAVQGPRVSNESQRVEAAFLDSTMADALLRARLKCWTSSLVRGALASRAESHDATRDELPSSCFVVITARTTADRHRDPTVP